MKPLLINICEDPVVLKRSELVGFSVSSLLERLFFKLAKLAINESKRVERGTDDE